MHALHLVSMKTGSDNVSCKDNGPYLGANVEIQPSASVAHLYDCVPYRNEAKLNNNCGNRRPHVPVVVVGCHHSTKNTDARWSCCHGNWISTGILWNIYVDALV